MIKAFIDFIRDKYKKSSVKRLLIELIGIDISIFIIIFIIILLFNWIMVKRINEVIYAQISVNNLVNQITQNFNKVTYSASADVTKNDYDNAISSFNKGISNSIHYIDEYLQNEKYYKVREMLKINKVFVDFKIYFNRYRALFLKLLEKKKMLSYNERTLDNLIDSLDVNLNNIESDISKELMKSDLNNGLKPSYKQAVTDLIFLDFDLKKLKVDLKTYISNILNSKEDSFNIPHRFAKIRFKINSIFLNINIYQERKLKIMGILKNIENNSLEDVSMAKNINQVSQDVYFNFNVIESMGYEFTQEVSLKINSIGNKLRALRRKVVLLISIIIGLSNIFIFVFIYIIKNRLFYPFTILLNAIKSTEQGNRDVMLKLDTEDEFKLLVDHFNRMSNSIKNRESELIKEKELVEAASEKLGILKKNIEDIIHASPNAIFTVDQDLRVTFLNKRASELSGKRDIIDEKLTDIECVINHYLDNIKEVMKEQKERILSKNEIIFASNSNKGVVNLYIYPLHTTNGMGAVIEVEDVTDRALMEKKMLESQKMETVGLLAGGFAHDFNNLLTGLMGYTELAKMSGDSKKILNYLKHISNISQHAAELVQQILLFSRSEPGKRELINIGFVIEEALAMIKAPINRDAKVIKEIESDLMLYADASQLTQALLNLIINAFDAVDNKNDGYVRIKAEKLKSVEEKGENTILENDLEYIKITIEDNGPGISEEVKSKIFDPFFTTKTRGNIKGTGLGLSIVYRVIKNHNGEIVVNSKEEGGTIFEVFLPVKKDENTIIKGTNNYETYKGSGCILLVDDEDMVRGVGKEILTSLGYDVIALKGGKECIEFFKRKENDVNLIIMDLIMPGMDGPETLKELSIMGIKIPVIIASGYITLDMSYLKNYDYVKGMIRKPYSIDDISIKLSKILK